MSMSLKYTCSKCGKRAILGQHFCNSLDVQKFQEKLNFDPDADLGYDRPETPAKNPPDRRRLYAASALIAGLVILVFAWQTLGQAALPALAIAAAAILAFLILRWIRLRFRDDTGKLVALCHGDRSLAERLIMAEMNRGQPRTRKQAIDVAIARLLNDRRR